MKDQIVKADNTDCKDLLRKIGKSQKDRIPFLITRNRNLPMMRKILDKNWNVLQINPELEETFQNYMFVAFKRNKNFQEIIGSHTIKYRKEFKTHLENRKAKYEPCNTNKSSLHCKEVQGYETQKLYNIFHNLNCKSKFIT